MSNLRHYNYIVNETLQNAISLNMSYSSSLVFLIFITCKHLYFKIQSHASKSIHITGLEWSQKLVKVRKTANKILNKLLRKVWQMRLFYPWLNHSRLFKVQRRVLDDLWVYIFKSYICVRLKKINCSNKDECCENYSISGSSEN